MWSPRSSAVFEDDYDEDPRYFGKGVGETVVSGSCKVTPKKSVTQKGEGAVVNKISHIREEGLENGHNCIENNSSPKKLISGSEAQLVGIEESLHLSMDNGSCLIFGPFGARRTCYHYRPQVKRCVTSLFKTYLRKVLPGSSCRNCKQLASYPYSLSTNLVCQKKTHHKKCYPRKSLSHKRYYLRHTSTRTHSQMFEGNIPCAFSSLIRRENIEWKASMHPFTYERILWRLPSSLWKQLELCLIDFEDDNALHFVTPVMYSLRRYNGLSRSRMVYSLSRDSYGVSERAWEDLVMAMCLCCILVFICRVYGGVHGCVTEILDWISL